MTVKKATESTAKLPLAIIVYENGTVRIEDATGEVIMWTSVKQIMKAQKEGKKR